MTKSNSDEEIKCLDDDPVASRLAARQNLILKWLKPTAMVPFILVLIINFTFFAHSNNGFLVALGLATVAWVTGVNIYSLFLRLTLRCPRCHNRFGSSDNCISCSLPRHRVPTESSNAVFEPLDI
jgi:hypothetical protein